MSELAEGIRRQEATPDATDMNRKDHANDINVLRNTDIDVLLR